MLYISFENSLLVSNLPAPSFLVYICISIVTSESNSHRSPTFNAKLHTNLEDLYNNKEEDMEGLTPFLLRAMNKQKPHNSYWSLCEGSSRSYHLLLASGSFNGSSHRQTRSEFQPSAVEQRSDLEFNRSHNSKKGSAPSSSWGGSYSGQVTKRAAHNFTDAQQPW